MGKFADARAAHLRATSCGADERNVALIEENRTKILHQFSEIFGSEFVNENLVLDFEHLRVVSVEPDGLSDAQWENFYFEVRPKDAPYGKGHVRLQAQFSDRGTGVAPDFYVGATVVDDTGAYRPEWEESEYLMALWDNAVHS